MIKYFDRLNSIKNDFMSKYDKIYQDMKKFTELKNVVNEGKSDVQLLDKQNTVPRKN